MSRLYSSRFNAVAQTVSGRVDASRTSQRHLSPLQLACKEALPYLQGMELHFTPEQEAQLAQIATKAGTDAEQLVKHTVLRLIQAAGNFRHPLPELPVWDLGAIGSLHRRDLYDDAR